MDIAQLERAMLGDLWTSPDLWNHLAFLCDTCNGRFAGTENERRAGDYLLACLRKYGLVNVIAEPFEMRGWERGGACLTILDGERESELPCQGLPGTRGCDLEAEIVDARQGAAADFQGLSAAGKIVLTSSAGPSRGDKYREAIEAGATAFIFSSDQPGMLAPTGSIDQDLPGIGLAYEHAARLKRLLAAGPVRARLSIQARVQPVTARNIIAEIPGTDPGEGWILAGGHYDGHDIAQGAQDNAAGTAILLEAARLLTPLRPHLKAGIRFVFFSGEELGLFGSYTYARVHAGELGQLRLVFNTDVVGMAMPLVLQTQGSPELARYLRSLPLQELDATVNDGPNSLIMNSDHFPFSLAGVAGVWALTSVPPTGHGWVHTSADTLDKLELRTLRQTASTAARLLLRMASEPAGLPRGCKTPEEVKKMVVEAGFEKALRFKGKWPFMGESYGGISA
jgi:Iap family predicted aminopeptidase